MFFKKANKKANKILGLLIILFTTSKMHFLFYLTGAYISYPHLLLIFEPFVFTYGPLFLLYERTLIEKSYVQCRRNIIYFIPFVICVAFYAPFYLSRIGFKELFLTTEGYNVLVDAVKYIEGLHVVQMIIYLIIICNDLRCYQKKILETFSSIEKVNLEWLKLLVKLFIIIYFFVAVMAILELLNYKELVLQYTKQIIGVLISICVYIVGYRGMVQPEIFVKFEDEKETNVIIEEKEKSVGEEGGAELMRYMMGKKPYLNEDLTLTELAEQTGMTRNQLSALINAVTGDNLYMLINKYRVEEVKHQLKNPAKSHNTILAIAFESGFKSKSSFHNIFKKLTGQTPIQYRAEQTI